MLSNNLATCNPTTCHATVHILLLEPPTVTVQSFCSVVVWTPPQLPCGDIASYEVRLYEPTSGDVVTRPVSNYTTFYIVGDEDKSLFNIDSVFVQV